MSHIPKIAAARAIIIAGPNGSGKTTFARQFLPTEGRIVSFINADLIAAGLSPFRPELAALEASRLMLDRMQSCVQRQENFAIETTLAGKSYLNFIKQWRKAGYQTKLIFLKLPTADLAVQRVAQGGHRILESNIRRRFDRGFDNFYKIYQSQVDFWQLFDASGYPVTLIDQGVNL